MLNPQLIQELNNKYLSKLKNLNINNKKLVICFSGVPASGKTNLAKILEKRYNGIRINKDEIGDMINKLKNIKTIEKENLADEYISYLFNNWNFKNLLIILDKSIDRKYNDILEILKNKRFPVFIIRINSNKEDIEKKIRERNKENLNEWLVKIDKWFDDFENCKSNVNSDFEFNDKNDLKNLFFMLDRNINSTI